MCAVEDTKDREKTGEKLGLAINYSMILATRETLPKFSRD